MLETLILVVAISVIVFGVIGYSLSLVRMPEQATRR